MCYLKLGGYEMKRRMQKSINIKLLLLVGIISVAVLLVGCNQDSISQNEEQYPQRIVSILPGMTEVLFELGLDERIVGVTANCDYPEAAKSKQVVGDWIINMEVLLSLEPDLVVGMPSANQATIQDIEQHGIDVLAIEAQSIADTIELYRKIGEVTGSVKRAEQIANNMEKILAELDEKVEKISSDDQKKVFMEIGYEPLFTVGRGSLQHELLERAGGKNVVQVDSPWVEYSVEQVIKDNPEAIIVLHPASTIEDVLSRNGYHNILAIEENNITTTIDANLLVRPTSRIVTGMEQIYEFLYE